MFLELGMSSVAHVSILSFLLCRSYPQTQVAAYMMKEYKMSLEEAIDRVRKKRSCINPNEGFMHQLKAYEGILKARWGKGRGGDEGSGEGERIGDGGEEEVDGIGRERRRGGERYGIRRESNKLGLKLHAC